VREKYIYLYAYTLAQQKLKRTQRRQKINKQRNAHAKFVMNVFCALRVLLWSKVSRLTGTKQIAISAVLVGEKPRGWLPDHAF